MTEQATHNLNFQSGMVQSWNKFCFTGGYLEFSAILPGNVGARGEFFNCLERGEEES